MSTGEMYKCLKWRSRRGMLELDVLLEPFTRDVFCLLSETDQAIYVRLLECEDPDLFNWLMGGGRPDDAGLASMVDKITQHGRYDARIA